MPVAERWNADYRRGPTGGFWSGIRARLTPVVAWLLLINIAAWVFQMLSMRLPALHNGFMNLFALYRDGVAQGYVWQLITYAFLHSPSPLHILFNMLLLFWMGPQVEGILGSRRFLSMYLLCGLIAGIAHIAVTPIPVIGASGAVLGLLAAYAHYFPNAVVLLMFIIPIQVKYLVWLLAGVNLLVAASGQQTGIAVFAHLGGLFTGMAFVRYGWLADRAIAQHQQKRRQRQETSRRDALRRVDELLEKIHRNPRGIQGLSFRERVFLKRASRRFKKDE